MEIVKLLFNAYPEAIYVEVELFRGTRTLFEYVRHRSQNREYGFLDEVSSFFESQLDFVRRASRDRAPDENGQLPIHRFLNNPELSLGAIKLMINANPESICVANNQGCIPLHIAVNRGDVGIVKCLIEANVESLTVSDLRGNCTLHHACLAGKCDIINCILRSSSHGASVRNSDGKLPIQLLLYDVDCERDNLEFVGAIHSLLCAYPNVRDIAL